MALRDLGVQCRCLKRFGSSMLCFFQSTVPAASCKALGEARHQSSWIYLWSLPCGALPSVGRRGRALLPSFFCVLCLQSCERSSPTTTGRRCSDFRLKYTSHGPQLIEVTQLSSICTTCSGTLISLRSQLSLQVNARMGGGSRFDDGNMYRERERENAPTPISLETSPVCLHWSIGSLLHCQPLHRIPYTGRTGSRMQSLDLGR